MAATTCWSGKEMKRKREKKLQRAEDKKLQRKECKPGHTRRGQEMQRREEGRKGNEKTREEDNLSSLE